MRVGERQNKIDGNEEAMTERRDEGRMNNRKRAKQNDPEILSVNYRF